MSPILVRPIREQFEHNRVIRLLQARFRRKFTVGINIGDEPEATGVRAGSSLVYPDLVLTAAEGVRRVHTVIEVETSESVNHLEAMAEWAAFGRARAAFHLYVPTGSTDVARRLCEESHVSVAEIWSYHAVGDQMRFTMTYRSARATAQATRTKRMAKATNTASPAASAVPKPVGALAATKKTAAKKTAAKTTAAEKTAAKTSAVGGKKR